MPKSKEYLSTSDSDSAAESDEPKPKKKKTAEAKPEQKDSKSGSKSGPSKGPGGEYMFQLANRRFATVSEFRGKVMVSIREYYEQDGQLKPGKKGISLSTEQWQALKDNITEIDECVKKF